MLKNLKQAVRMLNIDKELVDYGNLEKNIEKIKDELTNPTDRRIFYLVEALRRGINVKEIYILTGIDPFFLKKLD